MKLNDTELLDWIEMETQCGAAPCIVYDDNGNFAVSFRGQQPCPDGDKFTGGVSIEVWVEPDQWMPTIREAIQYAADNW